MTNTSKEQLTKLLDNLPIGSSITLPHGTVIQRVEEFDYRMILWSGKRRQGRGTCIGSIGLSAASNSIKWDQEAAK